VGIIIEYFILRTPELTEYYTIKKPSRQAETEQNLDKNTLENLIAQNYTQRQIGKTLKCSQSTVKYWLSKYGLETKLARANIPFCRKCGESDPNKLRKDWRYICRTCDTKRTIERFKKYKQSAVEYKGGKCQSCGYNKCLAALDFHHCDPNTKDPNWKNFKNRPFETIKKELDKCILLCKNCHAEKHAESG